MNIVLAAGEAVPYCKTGGLADVVGALAKQFPKKGHKVLLILPLYQPIDRQRFNLVPTGLELEIPVGNALHTVTVWEQDGIENPRVLFVENAHFFDRKGIYGEAPGSGFADNDQRYILYCRSIFEICKALAFKPDILHGHDWQTGLLPAYLDTVYSHDPFFSHCGSVFTIHNMAYQGLFPASSFALTGLPSHEYSPRGIEFYGQINFLKAGLVYSQALNTVSHTYANEIQNDWNYGAGLEGVINFRRDRFRGILNGLDQDVWDPKTDPQLKENFDVKTLAARKANKADLQKIAGWREEPSIPLLGFIGRLDAQKGIDTLSQLAPLLAQKNVQMTFLGSGDHQYQQRLRELNDHHRARIFYESRFREDLSHKIYGGCDIFLMPSKFEPCGLSQLIAMKYGAVPVVTPTGGLIDTVIPVDRYPNTGLGFMSRSKTYGDFLEAVFRALDMLTNKRRWSELQKRIMKMDYSWEPSLKLYVEMYKDAIQWRKAARV